MKERDLFCSFILHYLFVFNNAFHRGYSELQCLPLWNSF